jgi:hypothetical protein
MLILINNRIGGVTVRVLASNAVDRGFEPRAAKTKDYKIGMCCFTLSIHASLRRKIKGSESESTMPTQGEHVNHYVTNANETHLKFMNYVGEM